MVPLLDYQEQKLEELRGEGEGQDKCSKSLSLRSEHLGVLGGDHTLRTPELGSTLVLLVGKRARGTQ